MKERERESARERDREREREGERERERGERERRREAGRKRKRKKRGHTNVIVVICITFIVYSCNKDLTISQGTIRSLSSVPVQRATGSHDVGTGFLSIVIYHGRSISGELIER